MVALIVDLYLIARISPLIADAVRVSTCSLTLSVPIARISPLIAEKIDLFTQALLLSVPIARISPLIA